MKLVAIGAGVAACAAIVAGMVPGRQQKQYTVAVYLSTECPVASRQSPRIAALAKEFEGKGVTFIAFFPNEGETTAKINRYAKERKFEFPVALDIGGVRTAYDKIEITPTAVVRDSDNKVLYQGAIDDNKVDELVKASYLRDALTAITSGREPKIARTEAYGCYVMPGPKAPTVKEVNYAEHVAAILNDHCVECHRTGETAPFSLEGYEDARKWARMIARVTKDGRMPPWGAAEGIGEFHGENRLTDTEIETLLAWSTAGAPRGDVAKDPPAPKFNSGWELGKPDLEVQMPEPFQISSEGKDEYWNFVIDPKLDKEVYVTAMDVKPGNRKIVHHVIAFIDESNKSEKLVQGPKGDKKNAYLTFGGVGFNPDGAIGGWAPGVRAKKLPSGASFVLKPGSKIVMQVHYHKSGKDEVDQTRMGLYLDDKPPVHPVTIGWLANPFINIPAGKADAAFKQTIPIPMDIRLYSLMPHMHLLGKEMKATLIKPDGSQEPLIHIDKWDFNWQLVYSLKEPMLIKGGSKIQIEAIYDNSEANPNNPSNPPQAVRWGEETTDEMMLLVAVYTAKP